MTAEQIKSSPIKKILRRKESEKVLANEIYEKIFDAGVEKTAELFCIKPEEAVKLIITIIRKNNDFDKFYALADKRKLFSVCEKIEELQIISTKEFFEHNVNFAEKWEFLIAKEFLRQKLKREESG